MIRWLKRNFLLSDADATRTAKAAWLCLLRNLAVMAPCSLFCLALKIWLEGAPLPFSRQILIFSLSGLAILLILSALEYRVYDATFIQTYKISEQTRLNLADRLRRLPLAFFGKRDLSDLAHAMMRDVNSLEQMLGHAVPQLIAAIMSTTIIILNMFFFQWQLALALFAPLPVGLLLYALSYRKNLQYEREFKQSQLNSTEQLREVIGAIPALRAAVREEQAADEYAELLRRGEKAEIKTELGPGVTLNAAGIVFKLGFPLVALTAVHLLAKGALPLWKALCLLAFADLVYQAISLQSIFFYHLVVLKSSILRLHALNTTPELPGKEPFAPKNYDVTFEHVDFAYEDKEVLSDVSFVARQGQVTALVGPSGSGKSTAGRLTARFWDPRSGRVLIGGQDLKNVNPESLLRQISIVFQDVTLLNDTVRENVRLGRQSATDAEVEAAAKAAQCEEFICKLPQGYDTLIGENGSRLSGGERQRISIARALLKNAPLLLLDEATASLDADNESRLQAAMMTLLEGKTVLVIAHRLRTVLGADWIVALENGRVAELGRPDELLERKGLFARMVDIQHRSAGWKL